MGIFSDLCDAVSFHAEAAWDNVGRPVANAVTFGALDKSDAKAIRRRAQARQERAVADLESEKENTGRSLEQLGKAKQVAYSNGLSRFGKLYSRIGKVDVTPIKRRESGIDYKQFKVELKEIKTTTTALSTQLALAGGSLVAGAALATAAYGVGALVTTAAFGTLTGCAAQSATLAWLGGGALSAGGAGVAGGMAVLGGVALAPALVAAVWYGVSQGKQQLNEANNFADEVDVLVEKINSIILELQKIRKGADLFKEAIVSMAALMDYENGRLERIIDRLDDRDLWHKFIVDPVKRVFNMQVLTNQEASDFRDAVNCAKLLRAIIDKPIMNEEGAFLDEAIVMLEERTSMCNNLLGKARLPMIAA